MIQENLINYSPVAVLKCPACNRTFETTKEIIMSLCPCGHMNEIKIIIEVYDGI